MTTMSFESLSVSQTMGRVLSLFWSRKMTFWKIAAVVLLPGIIIQASMAAIVGHLLAHVINQQGEDSNSFEILMDVINKLAKDIPLLSLLALTYLMFSTALGVIGSGAMIRVAAEAHVDREAYWLDCIKAACSPKQFRSLFCAGFLLMFGVFMTYLLPIALLPTKVAWLGFLFLFVVPFVVFYVLVRMFPLYPAMVVEKTSVMGGISRSWELSRGAFCYFFCSSLFFGILQGLALWVANFAVGGTTESAFKPAGIILGAIFQQLPNFVFMPCYAILTTSLYLSRRIETEHLTKADLAHDLFSSEDGGDMASPLLLSGDGAHQTEAV